MKKTKTPLAIQILHTELFSLLIVPFLNIQEFMYLTRCLTRLLRLSCHNMPRSLKKRLYWDYVYYIMNMVSYAVKFEIHAPAGCVGWLPLRDYIGLTNPPTLEAVIDQKGLDQNLTLITDDPSVVLTNLRYALDQSLDSLNWERRTAYRNIVQRRKYYFKDSFEPGSSYPNIYENIEIDLFIKAYFRLEKYIYFSTFLFTAIGISTILGIIDLLAKFDNQNETFYIFLNYNGSMPIAFSLSTLGVFGILTANYRQIGYDIQDSKVIRRFIDHIDFFTSRFQKPLEKRKADLELKDREKSSNHHLISENESESTLVNHYPNNFRFRGESSNYHLMPGNDEDESKSGFYRNNLFKLFRCGQYQTPRRRFEILPCVVL